MQHMPFARSKPIKLTTALVELNTDHTSNYSERMTNGSIYYIKNLLMQH